MNKWAKWGFTIALGLGALVYLACQGEPKVAPSAKVVPPVSVTEAVVAEQYQDLMLLQSPEDGKYRLGLWGKDEDAYDLISKHWGKGLCEDLAIGEYPLQRLEGNIIASYPNDFYRTKLPNSKPVECIIDSTGLVFSSLYKQYDQALKVRLLVLPEVQMEQGSYRLAPCQACPHWKSEQYSRLTLEVNRILNR